MSGESVFASIGMHLRDVLAWRPTPNAQRSEHATIIGLSLVVGVGAGFGAIAFRWLIERATLIFSGSEDYSATIGHPPNHWVPWLGAFFVVLAPAVGGLIYGPLVHAFAREARGHGVPEVMYAIHKRGGRIPAKVAVVKGLASAITIGSGGSVGREGPIVQIGSAMGSSLARLARLPESRVRLLVACGAAGGIAATFNAPIAGVFFALELLLGSFAVSSFGAVVLSSVVASVIGRAFLGDDPFLVLPEFTVNSHTEYLLYVVLGLLAAGVALLFVKVLYGIEDLSDRIWKGPEWLRPGVGGLLLGLVLLVLPQMYGVGYPVLENAVDGKYVIGFLLILLVAKIFATSLTIGIGGSGGVFAPSLFLGAMLGAAFGQTMNYLFPGLGINPGAYALVAMAAVFSGAARAPITAVIILFELTGEYSIILPLMLAVVVATGASAALSKDTIYTKKLLRRGIDINARKQTSVLSTTTVRKAMDAPPRSLSTEMSLDEASKVLLSTRRRCLPVVSAEGEFVGVVRAGAAVSALAEDDDAPTVTVAQLIEWRTYLAPDATLDLCLDAMLEEEAGDGLPVLDEDGNVVGWLQQDAVLRAVTAPAT
ncbi:chloride channel protein [Demequina oxidasica]|uniref:chloride channel protein n=1 Tax=Demequina oxidasica TaxID=676199 RepID=UPI00191C2EA6|nr:chloride channel protein [Demequina oxidasica]